MDFKEVKNQEQWDEKVSSDSMSQFLQSWDWGEFQRNLGRKVWYLDLDGQYVLVIKMTLPLDKYYLYIPRTKIMINQDNLEFLKELALNEKCVFLRIEPVKQDLSKFGFKNYKAIQPAKTLLLDLAKDEETLLNEMHQKTRYNIRLAAKKGIKIKEGDLSDLGTFYNLISGTYQRKKIHVYNQDYFEKLLVNLEMAKLYLAEYEDKILCANLVVFYGDTATYLHGGSSEEYKNLMAPYLLQWEIIKKAKQLGLKYYDFWGIEERYPGVTRFKKGFAGSEIDYQGTFDLPLNNLWYLLYNLVKKFK